MKKLLFILPVIFFSLAMNAQGTQTEDEVYIGKGRTFGNYKGGAAKPINGQIKTVNGQRIMTGTVVSGCTKDCCERKRTFCSITVQQENTLVTFGTKDYGLSLPKDIVGRTISIEGVDPALLIRERRTVRKDYQREVQYAATGLKVLD